MPSAQREPHYCRDRAAACRRRAAQVSAADLRDSYLGLARAHEVLAEAVQPLNDTDRWFAAELAAAKGSARGLSVPA